MINRSQYYLKITYKWLNEISMFCRQNFKSTNITTVNLKFNSKVVRLLFISHDTPKVNFEFNLDFLTSE